jgi:hypothetical protein
MKTIKLFVILFAVSILGAQAQDCMFYYPAKQGTVIEMSSYNKKDKLTGSSKSTINEVSASVLKFTAESFDAKGKSQGKGDYQFTCEGSDVVIDMKQFLKGMNMEAYKDMEVNITSSKMTIPTKLSVGQKLNDGEINVSIKSGFVNMNILIKITNRTVEAFQDVTTPAGTFPCAKITYNVESKFMGTSKTKAVDFLSEKMGVVRNESYKEDGELMGYTVLTSVK